MIKDTIECPYCGNKIKVLIPQRSSFKASIVLQTLSLDVSFGSKIKVLKYKIKCPFCKKNYLLFDFSGNYMHLLSFTEFAEEVLGWMKRFNINLANIHKMVIGVVEPLYKPYSDFIRRFKRRFGKERDFTFIEIIFRFIHNGKEYRGILAGRLYYEPRLSLKIQNAYWIGGIPLI